MKKEAWEKYAIMVTGALVIGCGIGFVVYAALGSDSMTTFENGLAVTLKMSLSLATLLANLLFLVLLFLIDRKRVNVDTVLCPVCISLGVQLFSVFIPSVSSLPLRVLYMVVGLVVVGLGIGIGAQTETGSNPYDGFVMAVSEKVHKQYRLVRPVLDAFLLIVGILLKGSWGIGTIVAILLQGTIAQFFITRLASVYRGQHGQGRC